MINNINQILSQNVYEVEGILMEFIHKIVKQEECKELNIDSLEILIGNVVDKVKNTILSMAGMAFSNISGNQKTHCNCGKKLIVTKKNEKTSFLSMFGKITVARNKNFCRRCGTGHYETIWNEMEHQRWTIYCCTTC